MIANFLTVILLHFAILNLIAELYIMYMVTLFKDEQRAKWKYFDSKQDHSHKI